MPRAAVLLVLAAIGACRSPAPVQVRAAPIERPAAPAAGSLDPIPWSAGRPLTWHDFQAQPVVGTDAAALTATTIQARFACSGESFGFDVRAVFYPDRSWVNPPLFVELGSDRWALRHEQTHFDITELHARRMRQFFATLERPCTRTTRQLGDLADRFSDDASEAQARVDRETLNGRDGSAQARWDAELKRQLDALEAFAERP